MNISELTKRYEKVCEDLENLNASFRAHMMRNYFGNTIEQDTEFYKSLNKLELNLRIKNDEKSELMDIICSLKKQSIRDELTGIKCQTLNTG